MNGIQEWLSFYFKSPMHARRRLSGARSVHPVDEAEEHAASSPGRRADHASRPGVLRLMDPPPPRLQPALLGGLFIGVLSALPHRQHRKSAAACGCSAAGHWPCICGSRTGRAINAVRCRAESASSPGVSAVPAAPHLRSPARNDGRPPGGSCSSATRSRIPHIPPRCAT